MSGEVDKTVLTIPMAPFGMEPVSVTIKGYTMNDGGPGVVNILFALPDGSVRGYAIRAPMARDIAESMIKVAEASLSNLIVPDFGMNGQSRIPGMPE